MALVEYDLFGQKRDKVQTAIDRLRAFEPTEGYYVADRTAAGKTVPVSSSSARWQGLSLTRTTTRRRLTRHSLYASSGSITQKQKSKSLSIPCES